MKLIAPDLPETGPRYPDWILLATRAYISDRTNAATVAESRTSDGQPIHVSLSAAAPPAVSHLRVHCPGRNNEEPRFSYNPPVIFSREDLILLDVSFDDDRDTSDYFVYKAGGSRRTPSPSLVRIADPNPGVVSAGLLNTGIVRRRGGGADDDDHFAVAALARDYMTSMFHLSVFDSETGVWETRLLPLEPSESLPKPLERHFFFSKVIPLRGSLLGWVDLWRGILVCDVLSDDPELLYIPMPEPMPGNVVVEDEGEPTFFRDVTGCDDLITFVEMDYEDDGTPVADTSVYQPDLWTAVIGSRRLDSMEWEINHEVSIKDITVSEDCHGRTDLLPRFCENAGTPSLRKMPVGIPTLGISNSVVYLMSKVKFEDTKGWVVAVDMNSKRLEAVSRYSAASLCGFSTAYYPSSFSRYLNKNSTEIELNVQTADCQASTDTDDSSVNE